MPDLAPSPAPPELPPPPAPRRRRWWNLRTRPARKTPDRPCLNCGDPTVGFYCPTCGQKKVDVRVSLRRMMAEAMEDELFLNTTLPRTLGALLFRPGKLTHEYVQGHIVRYIQPLRLYLVASLLFFVLLPWLTNLGELEREMERESARQAAAEQAEGNAEADAAPRADTLAAAVVAGTRVAATRQNDDQPHINLPIDTAATPRLLKPAARHLVEARDRLNAMTPAEAVRTLRVAFMENAPYGIFLMMPLFAAILKVLYLRRKRFYVEHFVFALHVHAFTFITFLAMLVIPGKAFNAILSIWLMLYVWLAMKRVYGQGVVRTTVKYLILGWSYSFLVMVGVVFTALLTALTL